MCVLHHPCLDFGRTSCNLLSSCAYMRTDKSSSVGANLRLVPNKGLETPLKFEFNQRKRIDFKRSHSKFSWFAGTLGMLGEVAQFSQPRSRILCVLKLKAMRMQILQAVQCSASPAGRSEKAIRGHHFSRSASTPFERKRSSSTTPQIFSRAWLNKDATSKPFGHAGDSASSLQHQIANFQD